MPDPTISPTTVGSPVYTMKDTSAFVAVFEADIGSFESRTFHLQYLTTVTGVTASLVHIDVGTGTRITVPVPQSGDPSTVTVSHYSIVFTPGIVGANLVDVSIQVTETGGGVIMGELWEIRASADVSGDWSLGLDPDTDAVQLQWAAVDPVAGLNIPATTLELQDEVDLNARNANSGKTFAGSPPADLTASYAWTYTGAAPILDITNDPAHPTTTTAPLLKIKTPSVYEQVPLQFGLTTQFADPANVYSGFLRNSATAPMTIGQRRQDIVLVLDRSGSMASENRYENAKIASRSLIHLFYGLRRELGTDDRVAVVVFEDETAGFRPGPPSSRIQAILPLTPLEEAKNAVNDPAFDFGVPGANTPIGDGLLFAVDLLGSAGAITDQRFTIILLTDGQENSGHSTLVPSSATPTNGAISFQTAVNSSSTRKAVLDPARCTLSAIALGPTADQGVLSQLAAFHAGEFALANQSSELATSFGNMLVNKQAVNPLVKQTTPTTGLPDPDAPPAPAVLPAIYFSTEPDADRLVLAVTPAADSTVFTDTIQLARWDGASYLPQTVDIQATESDRSTSVTKLPAIAGGKTIDWRLIHGPGPGSAQQLSTDQVLVYVDLHLLADVLLDKPSYLTGDRMTLTVRIRQDDQPIRGAVVTATLDAPAVGLGQQLTALGDVSLPPTAGDPDLPPWLEQRIGALLTKQKWDTLPRTHPKGGLFVDGTSGLFDPEGDGNYTNTFAQVFKEGTYTWHLSVAGQDLNGNAFTRQLTISTFARVKVDPKVSTVKVTRIPHDPSGMLAALVVVLPQDKRGEDLGPGKDDAVIFALRDGTFQHVFNQRPAPVQIDGTYQRVILFDNRQRPTLQVKAAGVVLPTIDIRRRLLGFGDDD
jgi:hypothetical protein